MVKEWDESLFSVLFHSDMEIIFWFVKGFTCVNNEKDKENKKRACIFILGAFVPLFSFSFQLGFLCVCAKKQQKRDAKLIFLFCLPCDRNSLGNIPQIKHFSPEQVVPLVSKVPLRWVSVILSLVLQYKHTHTHTPTCNRVFLSWMHGVKFV